MCPDQSWGEHDGAERETMGQFVIRDGNLARRFESSEFAGRIEVDLAGDEPEVIVPEDVTVRRRGRPPDRRPRRR